MQPLSTDCIRFVFELCDEPIQLDVPEALVDASATVPEERVDAVANEVRALLDHDLLAADDTGRLRPTLDGLWCVLTRARELRMPVPAGLLVGLGTLMVVARN